MNQVGPLLELRIQPASEPVETDDTVKHNSAWYIRSGPWEEREQGGSENRVASTLTYLPNS